jgi:hypothetical protein
MKLLENRLLQRLARAIDLRRISGEPAPHT